MHLLVFVDRFRIKTSMYYLLNLNVSIMSAELVINEIGADIISYSGGCFTKYGVTLVAVPPLWRLFLFLACIEFIFIVFKICEFFISIDQVENNHLFVTFVAPTALI